MSRRGAVVVLAGPSGVGKGTVVAELLRRRPDLWLSVSATTRAPRPGEEHGQHYTFVSEEEFDGLVRAGAMLEQAAFAGGSYGTPAAPVAERVERGQSVLLEIELEGARQVRRSLPEAVLVFLAPPSMADLEARLRGRGTESPEAVERRLARARQELAALAEFDHVIVNDDVESAVAALVDLVPDPSDPVSDEHGRHRC